MTTDLSIPLRWIEGHIAELDHAAAGHEHEARAAVTDFDRDEADARLDSTRETQRAWREIQRLAAEHQSRGQRPPAARRGIAGRLHLH